MSDGNAAQSNLIKNGRQKTHVGVEQYGVPNKSFISQSTTSMVANTVRYNPLFITYSITITFLTFEVTTAPASDSNVRVGIYSADLDSQPVGGPLYDSGSVAVASGFTGVKSISDLSLTLNPGRYLIATNVSVDLSLRITQSPVMAVNASLGTSSLARGLQQAQTYGAFPNPGTLANSVDSANSGEANSVFFTWNE